jgi:hypothetical protein
VWTEFLNKRRRQWLQSSNTIKCFEDKEAHGLEMESDVMFLVMRLDDMATEPIIVGASQNYIKELEYFRDEIVGYPVSHFLAKSQPENPIWIDCMNWNLVYKREKGRELHLAQAGAHVKIGGDNLIVACAVPVEKVLGDLDLTIHRKLKAIANKVLSNEDFLKWAKMEYNQFVKEDEITFPNRCKPRFLESHNTFINVVQQRKQQLTKMLSKSSLSGLDLSIAQENVSKSKSKVEVDLRDVKTYEDIPDPAELCDVKPPAVRPKNIGSICHPGCKKACQFFFFSYKGCNKGFQCEFCHEGHISNRKAKAKAWIDKQNERAREQEMQASNFQSRPPVWVQNGPYWGAQNDAMALGFTPLTHVLAPVPEYRAPLHCANCANCGASGQVHGVHTPPQAILIPRQGPQPGFVQYAPPDYHWQQDYPPSQWQQDYGPPAPGQWVSPQPGYFPGEEQWAQESMGQCQYGQCAPR